MPQAEISRPHYRRVGRGYASNLTNRERDFLPPFQAVRSGLDVMIAIPDLSPWSSHRILILLTFTLQKSIMT
jgi:hypothetical protein